ncbi:MAG: putative toxin-antitoxin system toxin component, PIN family [Gammaproteobacteria bacterium]|nr:putative toxin-antitoxin system toxin component, PIN family [Gammaproteobacteria bacterium]
MIDTNVLVSGLQSSLGASYKLLSLIDSGKFQPVISVATFLEYEEILLRKEILQPADLNVFLLYLYKMSHRQSIYFLYRPSSPDPKDDLFIDLAIASGAEYIVTYNVKDLKAAMHHGIKVVTPRAFLEIIGELS